MKPPPITVSLLSTTSSPILLPKTTPFTKTRPHSAFTFSSLKISRQPKRRRCVWLRVSENLEANTNSFPENEALNFEVASPLVPVNFISTPKLSLGDQASFLITFIACTTSVAFTGLVVAAVPTLLAMQKAAISLSKLADTAREEIPSTMTAVRLSGMEISDLTLELSDLSQEITDGVNKSAQAVQMAEAGIRQIGSLAHQQTMSMIQERASLPIISLRPVVAGAAKKTTRVVGQATKSLLNIISRGESNSTVEDGNPIDRIES